MLLFLASTGTHSDLNNNPCTYTNTHRQMHAKAHEHLHIEYTVTHHTHAQLHRHAHTIHIHTDHHKIGTVETLENTGKWEPTEI